MRILIEDHKYETKDIKDILEGIVPFTKEETMKLPFVGYMYSKVHDDCIFFLPKVILNANGLVFDKFTPEQLLQMDKLTGEDGLTAEQRTMLYNFSIWIYQSINVYNKKVDNQIVKKRSISEVDFSANSVHVTILDNILALIKFANENKDFLLFTMRNIHSGYNKINWNQTISRRQPIMRKGKAPIYLNPINKKKEVDYEEELLVIFFSILRHINESFGFKVNYNHNFDLLSKSVFNNYLNGYGRLRLKDIKYKYFSDKTLRIWKLCYDFFAQSEKVSSSNQKEDYLLASDFDRVFESIIDDIIGQDPTEYPSYLKTQKDGKEIDHIFKFASLTDESQEVYYIGDSKYYKTGDGVSGNSEYKQYTYAKNVIQANIDMLLKERHGRKVNDPYIIYRDEKTEGYNITPNFFISASMNNYDFSDDSIEHRENDDTIKVHYDNRLFDRDTLMLSHYDINFLYVMTLYARNNDFTKNIYRAKAREMFRTETLNRLNERYDFYILTLKEKPTKGKEQEALNAAIDPIFRKVNGKVFCPKQDESYTNLILALEKPEILKEGKLKRRQENAEVLDAVKKDFKVYNKYSIGTPIASFLRKQK